MRVTFPLRTLGLCHLATGRFEESLTELERAVSIREAVEKTPLRLAEVHFPYARALHETGARERALAVARRARTEYEQAARTPLVDKDLAELDAWLAARAERPGAKALKKRKGAGARNLAERLGQADGLHRRDDDVRGVLPRRGDVLARLEAARAARDEARHVFRRVRAVRLARRRVEAVAALVERVRRDVVDERAAAFRASVAQLGRRLRGKAEVLHVPGGSSCWTRRASPRMTGSPLWAELVQIAVVRAAQSEDVHVRLEHRGAAARRRATGRTRGPCG